MILLSLPIFSVVMMSMLLAAIAQCYVLLYYNILSLPPLCMPFSTTATSAGCGYMFVSARARGRPRVSTTTSYHGKQDYFVH